VDKTVRPASGNARFLVSSTGPKHIALQITPTVAGELENPQVFFWGVDRPRIKRSPTQTRSIHALNHPGGIAQGKTILMPSVTKSDVTDSAI
jgi:hypothetical protein